LKWERETPCAATDHDGVHAFDSDCVNGNTSTYLWKVSLLSATRRYFLIRDNKTDLLAIRYLLREEHWAFREAEVRLGDQIIDLAAGEIVLRPHQQWQEIADVAALTEVDGCSPSVLLGPSARETS
jgi:hypothetical protein